MHVSTNGDVNQAKGKQRNRFTESGEKGIGLIGVHFRYHRPDEYRKLSHEQRKELQEWRSKDVEKATKKQRRDAAISAAVAKQVEEEVACLHKTSSWRPPSDEETGVNKAAVKACIMSAFEEFPKKQAEKNATVSAAAGGEIPMETEIPP